MKLATPNTPYILAGLAVLCAITSASARISRNITSNRILAERQTAMETVAKHVMSGTCMKTNIPSDTLLIGDVVPLRGDGKAPTSCIKAQGHYAHAAYLGGQYVITQVFSIEEINATKSQIKRK